MTVLLRPLINEKSMNLIKGGLYTFEVGADADKKTIRQAVRDKFKVDVVSIRTITIAGKVKTQPSRKGYYQRPSVKKAIVRVKKGQKILVFEAAESEQAVEVKTAEGETIAKTKEKKSLLGQTKVRIEKTAEPTVKTEERAEAQETGRGSGKPRRKRGAEQ